MKTCIPDTIRCFLKRSQVATVCFGNKGKPHAINCFFVHHLEKGLLILKSTQGSAHDRFVYDGEPVAGTILPDMISISKLRGLQFSGKTLASAGLDMDEAGRLYCGKFQFSKYLPGYFWAVELHHVKFTDNRVRFGHKVIWTRAG